MKPFIDPVTYSKVVLVSGEEDEEKMSLIIGEDWRELTGAGKERKVSSWATWHQGSNQGRE